MRFFILFFILCIIFPGCNFDKYNYTDIYGLSEKILSKSQNLNDGNGRTIKITNNEFIKIKKSFSKYGFSSWYPLFFISSGKFFLKDENNDVIFSRREKSINGRIPVIVYDKMNKLLYLIIADRIGG
jgi:hypothetical protein